MAEQEPQLVILAGPAGWAKLSRGFTMIKNGTSSVTLADEPVEARTFPDAKELEALAQRAVRRELRVHKALGNPIVIERDGQIVTIPPEEIQVDDEPSA